MNVLDKICNYIKSYLPLLTSYFGENIRNIEYVDFINKEIYVKFTEKHNLKTGQKIFFCNIEFPNKIVKKEDNIITTKRVHNLLSQYTNKVYIKTTNFEGKLPLLKDINWKNLEIDFSGVENFDVDNAYLIQKHTNIINGLRPIEVIDDFTVKIADYKLDVDDYRLTNPDYVVSIEQRVYGCFDLDDAMNNYCNSYGLNSTLSEEECFNKLNLRFKGNDNLTCFVALDTNITNQHNSLSSEGRLGYTLNLFVFQPIKGKNKYLNRDMIEYYTFQVFNKILGNKNLDFSDYLSQRQTNSLTFDSCSPAIDRNNVLYIAKISYKFNIMTNSDDFTMPEDYWRFNNLNFESDEKSFRIYY